jgi:histidyl-tRNA synthetase
VGLERIIDVIDDLGLAPKELGRTVTQALVTIFGPDTQAASLGLAAELRRAGVRTEIALSGDRIGRQLQYASRRQIPTVLILGPDELARNEVVVKDMASGEQRALPRGEAVNILCERYASLT